MLVTLDNIDLSVSDTPLTEEESPKPPFLDAIPEQVITETVPDDDPTEEIPKPNIPEENTENNTEDLPDEVPEEGEVVEMTVAEEVVAIARAQIGR